jgi:predicted nucleic acid-binding protein
MPFVLDCSVALAWLLPDEMSEQADSLMARLTWDTAHVPPVWPLEVANVLVSATRRRRITANERTRLLDELSALHVEVEPSVSERAFRDTLDIADTLGLTSYDASYVELARRREVPLATFDARLREASSSVKLKVLPDIMP